MPDPFFPLEKVEDFKPSESLTKELEDFDDIKDIRSQNVNHKISDRAPSVREIGEGEFQLAKVSGELRTYTKVDGTLRFMVWT